MRVLNEALSRDGKRQFVFFFLPFHLMCARLLHVSHIWLNKSLAEWLTGTRKGEDGEQKETNNLWLEAEVFFSCLFIWSCGTYVLSDALRTVHTNRGCFRKVNMRVVCVAVASARCHQTICRASVNTPALVFGGKHQKHQWYVLFHFLFRCNRFCFSTESGDQQTVTVTFFYYNLRDLEYLANLNYILEQINNSIAVGYFCWSGLQFVMFILPIDTNAVIGYGWRQAPKHWYTFRMKCEMAAQFDREI